MPEVTAAAPLAAIAAALGASSTSQVAAGSGLAFTKTSTGVFTLLPAVAYDRVVAFFGYATETFADNTGTKTLAKLGQGNDDDKFEATVPYSGPLVNRSIAPDSTSPGGQFVGILSANQPLILTVTAAVGDGTGGAVIAAVAIAAITAA